MLPNYEAWLTWWEATSLGCFSAARVIEDKEGDYETPKEIGWKKDESIPSNAIHVDVIAIKASELLVDTQLLVS